MRKAPAGLAQLVEHLICNQGVGGSNPSTGTICFYPFNCAGNDDVPGARIDADPTHCGKYIRNLYPPASVYKKKQIS